MLAWWEAARTSTCRTSQNRGQQQEHLNIGLSRSLSRNKKLTRLIPYNSASVLLQRCLDPYADITCVKMTRRFVDRPAQGGATIGQALSQRTQNQKQQPIKSYKQTLAKIYPWTGLYTPLHYITLPYNTYTQTSTPAPCEGCPTSLGI